MLKAKLRNPIRQQRVEREGLGTPTQNVERKRALRTFPILLPELTRSQGRGTSPSPATRPALIFFTQAGSSGSSFDLVLLQNWLQIQRRNCGMFCFHVFFGAPSKLGHNFEAPKGLFAHPVSRTHGSAHTEGMPGFTGCSWQVPKFPSGPQ